MIGTATRPNVIVPFQIERGMLRHYPTRIGATRRSARRRAGWTPGHGSSVKNDKQYEGLREQEPGGRDRQL